MLETAFRGGKKYWAWMGFLTALAGGGGVLYLVQHMCGLEMSGLSRDVSWGLYIANYTFFVGVAASAVMVVLPYYLHDHKAFTRISVLGEFLAVAAIFVAGLFIFVDVGLPSRMFNMALHPTPRSPLFWNMIILPAYLGLNLVIGWQTIQAQRNSVPAPGWTKWLVYISIPWAVSIHTVTAFVYSGLAGRPFWNSAVLAPRFLVSAFASGPALLLLLCVILRKLTRFDSGKGAMHGLAVIVTYSLIANIFLFACECFVVFYGNIPSHVHHLQCLFFGLEQHGTLVLWMWLSLVMMLLAVALFLIPSIRGSENGLALACVMTITGIWIDKGLGIIAAGFVPNPFGRVTEYVPTLAEIAVSVGVCAAGLLVLTVLYKMALQNLLPAEGAGRD